MKNFNLVYFTIICLVITIKASGQSQFPDIDPIWDTYYDRYPSGIENNYKAVDFIRIIEATHFIPQGTLLRNDVQLLKKGLLMFDVAALRQMMMTGNYYSRTYKHDDYFELYNLYYSKISSETWIKYCPYLIPLMDLDGVLDLK
jgi:hypothetical protein